ncbi:MAG TPA: MFS transporter [Mycobacteriales bacterium]|nr:MFS transporter [Mycobacteriales bacterium]
MLPGRVEAEPARPVRARFVATLALANLALWMGFFTPIQLLLPQQLEDIDADGKVGALGWVTGAGAAVAVLVTPLAGALSDRTTSRWGRRLPWLVGGTLAAAAAFVVLSRQSTVLGVLVGWCLAQACLNAAYAALTAEVPDHVPVRQRGVVSGWFGLPQAVGVVVGVALVTSFTTTSGAGYLLVAAVIAVLVLPFAAVTRDARLSRADRPRWSWSGFARGFWVSPRRHPDFGWAWLTRFLISLGNALGTLYLLYFLRDRVRYEELFPGRTAEDGVLVLILIYAAGAVATAVVGGVVSDRSGRRKPLVIASSVVMAAGAALLAVSPTWTAALVAAALLGTGYGVYMAVDTALITQVLPTAGDRGKDLGVINIANAAPQVLAPALAAPIVATLGGYPVLYGLTAAVTLLGAVLVLPIRSVR